MEKLLIYVVTFNHEKFIEKTVKRIDQKVFENKLKGWENSLCWETTKSVLISMKAVRRRWKIVRYW